MGFDLSALVGKNAVTTVDFLGQSAVVTYDPNILTSDRLTKSDLGDSSFMELFVELVKDWDVTKAKRKVPITVKGIGGVPMPFLRAVFIHIMREAGAGESGKASNAG